MMNGNEAAAALAEVGRTERKLAEHARWPFHRHAMFGLAEGLLIAGLAQPMRIGGGMTAAALALLVVCVMDDRRRHGMFVSGWQAGATRPLTILLSLFVVLMVVASLAVRDGGSAQPLGFLIGAITFAVCTAASLRWEKIYRAQLTGEGRR
jgi:hypothetical protein